MTVLLPINDDCTVLLRAITDDEPALRADARLTAAELAELDTITHPGQRVEWLACRVAIRQLIEGQGLRYAGLRKDEFGKPHLLDVSDPVKTDLEKRNAEPPDVSTPGHISLSHTTGWAAAVLHRTRPVGIDIEPVREQFRRVVPRVLSGSELAHANNDPTRLAVYWCAKESMYKRYGKRQLTFREHLLIEPFADGAEQLVGHVRLPHHEERLSIRCYTIGPGLLAVAY